MYYESNLTDALKVLWEMYKAALMSEVANNPKVRDEFTVLYEDLLELIKNGRGNPAVHD